MELRGVLHILFVPFLCDSVGEHIKEHVFSVGENCWKMCLDWKRHNHHHKGDDMHFKNTITHSYSCYFNDIRNELHTPVLNIRSYGWWNIYSFHTLKVISQMLTLELNLEPEYN